MSGLAGGTMQGGQQTMATRKAGQILPRLLVDESSSIPALMTRWETWAWQLERTSYNLQSLKDLLSGPS